MSNAVYRVQASELLKLKALARRGDEPCMAVKNSGDDEPKHVALKATWSKQGMLFSRGDRRVRVHGSFDGGNGSANVSATIAATLPKWVATFDNGSVFEVSLSSDGVEFKHGRSTLAFPEIKDATFDKSTFPDIPDSAFASGIEFDDVDALRKVLQAHMQINPASVRKHVQGDSREIWNNLCVRMDGKNSLLVMAIAGDGQAGYRNVLRGRAFGDGSDKHDFLLPSAEVLEVLSKSHASGSVRLSFAYSWALRIESDGVSDIILVGSSYKWPNASAVFAGLKPLANVDVRALRKIVKFAKDTARDRKEVSLSFVPGYGIIAITKHAGHMSRFDVAAVVHSDDVVSGKIGIDTLERFTRVLPTSDNVTLSSGDGHSWTRLGAAFGDATVVCAIMRGADVTVDVPEEWPAAGEHAPEVTESKRATRKKPVAKAKPVAEVAAKPVARRKPKAEAKQKPEPVAKQKPEPKREPEATTQVIPEVPPKANGKAHVVKVSESVIPALVIFRDLPGMGDVPRRDVRKVRDSRGRKVAYVVRTAGSVQILWRDWYTHDDVSLDATVRALAESWAKAA